MTSCLSQQLQFHQVLQQQQVLHLHQKVQAKVLLLLTFSFNQWIEFWIKMAGLIQFLLALPSPKITKVNVYTSCFLTHTKTSRTSKIQKCRSTQTSATNLKFSAIKSMQF
jgi:hypothetical protein